jgi:hypothetical protein
MSANIKSVLENLSDWLVDEQLTNKKSAASREKTTCIRREILFIAPHLFI